MELTPQRLREVEFKERWRGYDPEEVDDLLERVAAGLEDFENRVRQATERAVRAEQRASEGSDTDETLRRTLVLAQRTADAAIADADERARQLVTDAEQRAATMVRDAEAEARRITEENETRLRENVSSLETARSTLQHDVDALGRYLTDERARIRTTLQALIERIDGDLQRDKSAPTASEVEVPEPVPAADEPPQHEADAPAEAEELAAIDLVGAERTPEGDATQAHDVLADDGAVADAPAEHAAGEHAAGEHDGGAAAGAADRPSTAGAAGATAAADHDLVLSGPGREIDTDDDAFFAQLRGALDDDEPLGPRDDEPVPNHVGASGPALFDQEGADEGRLGPFLRRKRRDN